MEGRAVLNPRPALILPARRQSDPLRQAQRQLLAEDQRGLLRTEDMEAVGTARRPAHRVGRGDVVRVVDDDAPGGHRREAGLHPTAARGEGNGAAQVTHQSVVRVHGAAELESPVDLVDDRGVGGQLDAGVGQTAHVGELRPEVAVRRNLPHREQRVGREAMIPRRLEGDTILEEGGIEAQLGFPRALRADVGVAYAARQEAGQAGGRAGYLGPDGIERAWGAPRPAERAAQLDLTHARGPERLV